MFNSKDDYNRKIYISDIKSGIIHYFFAYFFIMLVVFLLSFTYTKSFMKHQYTAVGLLGTSKFQNVPTLNTLATVPKNNEVLIKVVEELNSEGHYMIGKNEITPIFLNASLNSQYISNSLNIRVSLTVQDKNMSIVVINKVLDVSKTFANERYEAFSASVIVPQYASGANQTGQSRSLILSLGVMFGILICALHLYYKLFFSNSLNSTFLLDLKEISYVESKHFKTINRRTKGDSEQVSSEVLLNQLIKSKISSVGLFSLD